MKIMVGESTTARLNEDAHWVLGATKNMSTKYFVADAFDGYHLLFHDPKRICHDWYWEFSFPRDYDNLITFCEVEIG